MIPRIAFEELKGKDIKVYLNGLPDPHCAQRGVVESVTEHLLVLKDEDHTDIIYIPLESIVFFKKL